jgi:hypothetical protein
MFVPVEVHTVTLKIANGEQRACVVALWRSASMPKSIGPGLGSWTTSKRRDQGNK